MDSAALRIFENMGICNNSPAGSPKYIVIYFLAICCVQLADEAPFTNALSFNFTSIGPQHQNVSITCYLDANITDQGIQVTPGSTYKAGRATYFQPLQLWDKASGNLTDFNTYFAFVIDSSGSSRHADGLAFLLAPTADSPDEIGVGGFLGLPIDPFTRQPLRPFLAVEFDTFRNTLWDPVTGLKTHVGIDICSLTSNVTQDWFSNITGGATNEVWITYNSSSKNLSVVFSTSPVNNTRIDGALHFLVDLRHYLPEQVAIGFSGGTGGLSEKKNIKSWSFSSSLVVPNKTASSNKRLVVGLSAGLAVLVVVLALASFFFWKKRRQNKEAKEFAIDLPMDSDFEVGTGPKKFSYNELFLSTESFSEKHKLGEGGFGGVYKGFLRELNSYVAVKRISKGSKQGIKEYASEVKIISRLRHRNLVQLVGWCHEKKQLLLVYEFMENGSLDSHLFKQKTLLTWPIRYKIAKDLASGLLYLHEEWEQCVVHRDVKPSNVMLDSNFNAKLGDFGLARLVDHDKGSQTTILAGTMGYIAPEYVDTGKASKESDVYSFGIVALEIACGRKSIDHKVPENQMRLLEWVWNLYGVGQLLDAVDPRIGMDFDKQEMETLMIVGLWCAHPDHNCRPSIRQAIQVLNFEAPLPMLPSTMPIATYDASSLNPSVVSFSSSANVSQFSSFTYLR